MNITEVIRDVLQYPGFSYAVNDPSLINEGDCSQFATKVVDRLGAGKVVWSCDNPEWDQVLGDWCRAFVEYEGKYYDSEAPEGVNTVFELPFYKRHGAKTIYAAPV